MKLSALANREQEEERDMMSPTTAGAPTAEYLERPEGRIAYDVTGEGPLVVAAPGLGDLRSVYRFLTPGLVESGYRVATMDLRGHGDSDATFSSYDDVAAGTDMAALAEHLGGPAILVGNSMAAGAAVWAAAEHPDLVRALVLVGPFVRDIPLGLASKLTLRLGLRKPWGPAVWNAYYAKVYPGRPPADLAEHRGRIRESFRRPGHWRAFVATTRTSHAPAEARLGDVHAPTLVVMGERDADFPDPGAEARLIGERTGAQVVIVPDAGHYPQAEYPEVVTPAVVGFLAEATGRA
jgi:pimeloyl-ACP methyl ester carboxylesterase